MPMCMPRDANVMPRDANVQFANVPMCPMCSRDQVYSSSRSAFFSGFPAAWISIGSQAQAII